MTRRTIAGLAVLAAVGCMRHEPGPDTAMSLAFPPVDGRQVYLQACASCHGIHGLGDGPVAPALTHRPADLTRLAERNGGVFPREAFIGVISGEQQIDAHGTREMPVWSARFGEHVADAAAALYAHRRAQALADYVETLGRAPADAGPY